MITQSVKMNNPAWANGLVALYGFWHHRLGLPGCGWLMRRAARLAPALRRHSLRIADGQRAVVDFRDAGAYVWLNFALGESWPESHLITVLERIAKPGLVLWDVGANIGSVSWHFAQPRFGLRRIHCFEPNPVVLPTLRSVVTPFACARVHDVGLGAKDAEASLHVDSRDSSMGSISHPGEADGSITVRVRSGDSFLQTEADTLAPDLVKIDVEGYELEVLEGMRDILVQRRPIVFFEHIFVRPGDALALCADYTLEYLSADGRLVAAQEGTCGGHNAVLVPSSKLAEWVARTADLRPGAAKRA